MPLETEGTDPGEGIAGIGTTLVGAVTGPLGMITKIGIAGVDVDSYDVTTMNSPNRYKKFIAGLKDSKDISVDLIYEPSNTARIYAALGAANEDWTIEYPDGATFVCSGHIKNLGQQIPYNDKITQTMSIQLSGPPTWTNPSGVGAMGPEAAALAAGGGPLVNVNAGDTELPKEHAELQKAAKEQQEQAGKEKEPKAGTPARPVPVGGK